MKRSISAALCLWLVICHMTVFTSCGRTTWDIAVVTDGGQLMDGGVNQGAYEGAKAYAEKNNINYQYYQPPNGTAASHSDRIEAMRQAIANGAKIIVASGSQQETAIKLVAKESPDVKFIFVNGGAMGIENVTSVVYKEEESGYMAGYAAVIEGYTKLGGTFGGGGYDHVCNTAGLGFVQGAAAAASERGVDIEIRYSYKHGNSHDPSPELRTQIAGWYADGTEIVFVCGGSDMLQSVKFAAEESESGKIIASDLVRSDLNDRIIISTVKDIAVSVEKILGGFYAGEWSEKFANRVCNMGTDDNAVGIIFDAAKFKKFKKAKYDALFAKIKGEDIVVSSEVPNDCNNAEWLVNAVGNNAHVTIVFDK